MVPIRIDLDLEGYRLKDTFCINFYEKQITPEHIADILCEDFDLPVPFCKPSIVSSIKEQINDFATYGMSQDYEQNIRIPIKVYLLLTAVGHNRWKYFIE